MKTCLLSTIYDPQGKMYEPIKQLFPRLVELYDDVIISVTDKTHPAIIDTIGKYANVGPTAGMANGRRRVLELGLKTNADYFHYCDFDRMLFWIAHYPKQLEHTIQDTKGIDKMAILERSDDAFASHPFLQRLTEWIINCRYSNGRYTDFLTGSRIIPAYLARLIVEKSKATNGAELDIEWPMIAGLENLIYLKVDGLAYEHKYLGLEKPFNQEIKTRIDNMISALRLNV